MAPHSPVPPSTAPTSPPWSDPARFSAFAELVHTSLAPADGATHLLAVEPAGDGASLGFWEVPGGLAHPAAPLVGFRAPETWAAAGLHVRGRRHDLTAPDRPALPVTSTTLLARGGLAVTVVESAEGTEVLSGAGDLAPEGVAADILARVLGRPTPPPEQSPATYLDACWLDRVAATALDRPTAVRSWRWLADRHPLRGTGPVPEPAQLAARARSEALATSWAVLLQRFAEVALPAAEWGPPGGSVLPAGTWFDEGSLCRWLLRSLPPVDALCSDLLAVLPPALGEQLVDGLAAA